MNKYFSNIFITHWAFGSNIDPFALNLQKINLTGHPKGVQ